MKEYYSQKYGKIGVVIVFPKAEEKPEGNVKSYRPMMGKREKVIVGIFRWRRQYSFRAGKGMGMSVVDKI